MVRRSWRLWAGRGALLALLLQLALPLLGAQQAAAQPGPSGPLLICTGTGLVWVDLDGTPARDGKRSSYHCPACLNRPLVGAALLPTVPALLAPAAACADLPVAAPARVSATASAPPLPARGPPWA